MIVVENLSKSFGRVKPLDGVSLTVAASDAAAVLGPSGSGKTTLLRLIAGLCEPDEGVVRIAGRLASRPGWMLEPSARGISMVFQSSALWPHMSVEQNVAFGLGGLSRRGAHRRVRELLERMSLSGFRRRYPAELSGGEARGVAIARALSPRPRLLLLEEPLVHLNPNPKSQVLAEIRRAARETKATLIYVTHDPAEAGGVSEKVLVLKVGRLEAQ